MSTTSQSLLEQAQKLIKKAKEIEAQEQRKIGEAVHKLYKDGKITEQIVLDTIAKIINPVKVEKAKK